MRLTVHQIATLNAVCDYASSTTREVARSCKTSSAIAGIGLHALARRGLVTVKENDEWVATPKGVKELHRQLEQVRTDDSS